MIIHLASITGLKKMTYQLEVVISIAGLWVMILKYIVPRCK